MELTSGPLPSLIYWSPFPPFCSLLCSNNKYLNRTKLSHLSINCSLAAVLFSGFASIKGPLPIKTRHYSSTFRHLTWKLTHSRLYIHACFRVQLTVSFHLSLFSFQERQEAQHHSSNTALRPSPRLHRWVANSSYFTFVKSYCSRLVATSFSCHYFLWITPRRSTVAQPGILIWTGVLHISERQKRSACWHRAEAENILCVWSYCVFCHFVLLGLLVTLSNVMELAQRAEWKHMQACGAQARAHTHAQIFIWVWPLIHRRMQSFYLLQFPN